ncbi:MAG: DEAD/DEAH box helicase [Acidimicrobiia bacterium]|nr:DEAD/DEAH box helicase [Acidimicrobiia bacterium]
MEKAITTSTSRAEQGSSQPGPGLGLSVSEFTDLVQDHLDGFADAGQIELLRANQRAWVAALLRLYDDADQALDDVSRRVKGRERALVVADFEAELARIDAMLTELVGPAPSNKAPDKPPSEAAASSGNAQLQLSWIPGHVVAWSAGHNATPEPTEVLRERLADAGAGSLGWEEHNQVKVPGGGKADAVSVPIGASLGWLVALGQTTEDESTGPSVAWLGHVTALAVRLVAEGRMVPQLKKARRPRQDGKKETKKDDKSYFAVRWAPALVDPDEFRDLVKSLPGAVSVLENRPDAKAMTHAVLTDLITGICTEAASRLDVPAGPPEPRSKSDVAEAFLAELRGEPFQAPSRLASELGRRIDQWARPVSGTAKSRLVLQLDPPDDMNAWYLAVLAANSENQLLPVEQVIVNSSNTRRKEVEEELSRLERLYPELLRPGARRRGEVVLSQDEAWKLMTVDGMVLTAAGFDVRAPALSRKKPSPALRLTSEEAQESVVGAQQLADVRWSVVFDDIELTAEEISELASQARPLVNSRGRWVELDQADLAEAAAALAERADQTRLSGADMLRHALGLEGTPFSGGIAIAGDGWAADLLKSAADLPEDPPTQPDGFVGELRTYQADARMWLSFLDGAGLGGCLALDMGLGKTPTMLAHLRVTMDTGPALVVAPPAVVGNWASEAKRFVPDLRVVVHHGPNRADQRSIPGMAKRADLIITTYGTAVRDVDALEKIEWGKVVLDEAQAIKNPTSETAQQLRRIEARTRIALTGTPIENGLGDLWAIMDYTNPGLVGPRAPFVSQLSQNGDARAGAEQALRALNGILVFRRTKAEPAIAAELPDRIDELDLCSMTTEQIGLYQAVLDNLLVTTTTEEGPQKKGAVLAAITALKQICNHPASYEDDDEPLDGRSGKLARLNEIVDNVFAAGERVLIFTHFASWGEKLANYLTERTGIPISCYHGGLSRGARDKMVDQFQSNTKAGAMVLSLKAGGTGLNLTAASHVVLYDRWWNPAVEDQARDRVWRIGQKSTVVCHRLVCPGTVDERVEEVVAGKRQIADLVLPKSSSVGDLDAEQLQRALGIDPDVVLAELDADLVSQQPGPSAQDDELAVEAPEETASSDRSSPADAAPMTQSNTNDDDGGDREGHREQVAEASA